MKAATPKLVWTARRMKFRAVLRGPEKLIVQDFGPFTGAGTTIHFLIVGINIAAAHEVGFVENPSPMPMSSLSHVSRMLRGESLSFLLHLEAMTHDATARRRSGVPTVTKGGGRVRGLLWVVGFVLLLVASVRLINGFRILLLDPDINLDLYSRWREQRYLYEGKNPNELGDAAALDYLTHAPPARNDFQRRFLAQLEKYYGQNPACCRDHSVDPRIGPIGFWEGTYPGWSYFTAAAFVLPANKRLTRIYFGLLDLLALATIAVWAFRLGRPHSKAGAVFLAASALAMVANYRTLDRGQYGLIITALLIGVYLLAHTRRQVTAGFLYGLAVIKPHFSALFAIIFLIRKQWALLATAAAYVVFGSLCIWALSKTSPLEMLSQSLRAGVSRGNDGGESSFLSILMVLDPSVDRMFAARILAASGLISAGVLMWIWRNSGTLPLFAIAATIGRLWSYHHNYDSVIMVFPLIALGEALLLRYSTSVALAFCAVAISLWSPMRSVGGSLLPFQIAQIVIWLNGLAVLLGSDPPSAERLPGWRPINAPAFKFE